MSTIKHRVCTLAVCALLAACGGGGNEDAAEFVPALATKPAPSVLVVGDSTMTPYWPGERSTVDYLPWPSANLAVSGSTACDADLVAIRAARARVVVANYGLNDAYGANGSPRHSPERYSDCLRDIDRAARDAGSVLVLLAANPTLPSPGWDAGRIDDYNAVKRSIGAYYCPMPALAWSSTHLPDGQHPSQAAKPAIAAALADCIARSVGA